MHQLALSLTHFEDPQASIEIRWNIHDTPPASLWLGRLKKEIDSEVKPFARFTGFLYGPKNIISLNKKLNQAIEVINDYGEYQIEERANGKWSQDFSNAIHHHFEVLVGKQEKPAEFFENCSDINVRSAALALNHIAHDMEAYERSKERQEAWPDSYFSAIIVEMLQSKRFKFPEFIYDYFTLETKFEGLYLHYSQIGKTWWEVFLDKDEHIFPEAIDPHSALTSSFDIFFGSYSPDKKTLKEFHKFLKENGQDINNKKLALGFCPIGDLVDAHKKTPEQWRKLIGEHSYLSSLKIIKNGETISSRSIERDNPIYFHN